MTRTPEALRDQVAVITGAASGIGLALAERFGRAGMKLVLVDVDGAALEREAARLASEGRVVDAQRVDVSDGAQMEALAAHVHEAHGPAWLLCNNAGVGSPGRTWELTENDWRFVLGVNLWGVIHALRAFVPAMVEANRGHVVNTASMAGLVSVPGMPAYNASKHAVVTISETLRGELQMRDGNGVGVSVLCPGFVRTQIWNAGRNRPDDLRDAATPEPDEAAGAWMRGLVEAGIEPADVAERVHEAVLDDQFYILTHAHTRDALMHRASAIVDRGQLAPVDVRRIVPGEGNPGV